MITKLLVANRGEIAARIIRTAQALGIRTVAIFSDVDGSLPFVGDADEAVHLEGSSASETYLRSDLLLDAARRTRADAIHPGYGFLSEHADFARRCHDAGLVFVGPPASAIELMGSKVRSKAIMKKAGVPVLAGATVDPKASSEETGSSAAIVGYPLLIKASAGGGGRGMRIVRTPDELTDAIASAQREAEAAFGDGTVFMEKWVEHAKHVEVQILADAFGNVAHLFERECSVQRRHQKVIEEAPSPVVDDQLRAEMTQAAITAARVVGYVNAGTVEFVLRPDRTFAFLEMNTRLQVEHPVTEMVLGLDLVELQLRVAQGEALPDEVFHVGLNGHAIEARLYAEDARSHFLPTSGRLDRFDVPLHEGIRVDSGYRSGNTVSTHYDAMLAKIIAWGPNRTVAASRLSEAIERAEVHGVPTNTSLLVNVLRHEEFLSGAFDTGFLDRYGLELAERPALDSDTRRFHAIAAALMRHFVSVRSSPLPSGLPSGWRNVGPAHQPFQLQLDDEVITVLLDWTRAGVRASVDGDWVDVLVNSSDSFLIDLEVDRHRLTCRVEWTQHTPTEIVISVDSPLGSTRMSELPRFPIPGQEERHGSLISPMPGTIVRIDATAGHHVEVGTPLVVLEAMKMEHVLRAPHSGVVCEIPVALGSQVDRGTVLVVLLDEPTASAGETKGV